VTSLADRLKIDFALIHKDASRKDDNGVKQNRYAYLANKPTLSASTSVDSLCSILTNPNPLARPAVPIQEPSQQARGLTLVGDVAGKVAFIVVCSCLHSYGLMQSSGRHY
jgi:phosphoribosylpyrophosphate synthetase